MKISAASTIGLADWHGQKFDRSVGDIVWAKLEGFSYWPSIVTEAEERPGRRYEGCVHINFLGYENDVS